MRRVSTMAWPSVNEKFCYSRYLTRIFAVGDLTGIQNSAEYYAP